MARLYEFFTVWVVVLAIAGKWTSRWFDLMLLSFVTLFVGLCLSFIHPRRYTLRVGGKDRIVDGIERLVVVDLLAHVLVFVVVAATVGPSNDPIKIVNSISLMTVYALLVDVPEVYGVKLREGGMLVAAACAAYLCVFGR